MAVLSAEVMCDILDIAVPRCDTRYSPSASPSYAELKKLCLVCRSWSTYIQYRLFDHVQLATFEARLAFLRATTARTQRGNDLRRTTRTLVLTGPIFRRDAPRDIRDVLAVLPNLTTVHMKGDFALSYLPPSRHAISDFPAILRLDIEMLPRSSWQTLHDLLHQLPTLQHLAIRDSNATGSIPAIRDPPFSFSLKEFVLVCPWKSVPADYVAAFLRQSVGHLEVMALSMISGEPGLGALVAAHSVTLRSVGLNTAEPNAVDLESLRGCKRLEQLVVTGFDAEMVGALPGTLRRLQFNAPVLSEGQPVEDVFTPALQAAIKDLPRLETVFLLGRHAAETHGRKPDAGIVEQTAEGYAGLREECVKRGVKFQTPFTSDDNNQWTRFYELAYDNDLNA